MKRVRYYDLLRVICFSMIIYYHILVQLGIDGIFDIAQVSRWYETTNFHLATTPVAVFFLLSGASLGLTADESFSVKSYYKKRLIRLLVPFYLCTIVCMSLVLAMGIHFPGFEPSKTPAWRIIFNILGMDTWVSMHGITTFTLGLGEWFLGELMIFSLLFPLFRKLIQKFPKSFLSMATLVYASTIYLYGLGYFSNVQIHVNLLLKCYEFILGIYLGMYHRQIPKKCSFLTMLIFISLAFCPVSVPISSGIKNTILALCLFLSCTGLESFLQKKKLHWIDVLSGCSYELFLCHHMLIYLVSKVFESHIHSTLSLLLFFAVEVGGIALVTFVFKAVSDPIVELLLGHKKKIT